MGLNADKKKKKGGGWKLTAELAVTHLITRSVTAHATGQTAANGAQNSTFARRTIGLEPLLVLLVILLLRRELLTSGRTVLLLSGVAVSIGIPLALTLTLALSLRGVLVVLVVVLGRHGDCQVVNSNCVKRFRVKCRRKEKYPRMLR